jgi:alkylation response protein AidB-like acyl-CoA dehydrogenase
MDPTAMNFDDSPDDARFRSEVRAWLDGHAERRRGLDDWSLNHEAPDYVTRCRTWQHTLYEGGWGAITWPVEYGGRGESAWRQAIFNQEVAGFDVSVGVFSVGIGMCGPTLITHGSEEQKHRFLGAMLRGEEVWCQLFSEPDAGSDLAGLKTRAVRDGDTFVVNGQKVWTSGAQHSD